MSGEKDLNILLKNMQPILNTGEYVFSVTQNIDKISRSDTLFEFKEKEGITLVLEKNKAKSLQLEYQYTCAWITLKIHSSLEAVGLTSAFSNALTLNNISCNVVAGFYHDHIFVATKDAAKAMQVLNELSKQQL